MKREKLSHLSIIAASIYAWCILATVQLCAHDTAQTPSPPHSPEIGRVYTLQEVSVAPKAIKRVRPIYPEKLRNAGISGEAIEQFVIGHDGKVTNIKTVRTTDPAFGIAAEEMIPKWQFLPGRLNGLAVDVAMTMPVTFNLTSKTE